MLKRLGAAVICLALAAAACGACADSWNGTVAALETVQVTAPATGIPEQLELEAGAYVTEGETIGTVRAEKVFAPYDGTVATLSAEEGAEVSGTVLEISPVSLYTVSCTVSNTAKTAENALIHVGETVYVSCVTDGSHRAAAVVTAVSGAEWTAETVAGELFIGEAVYLYRDAECSAGKRIGKGTVTARDPLAVSAEGVISHLRVRSGDRVERGQWLFSVSSSADREIRIPAAGIVTEVGFATGEQVTEDQVLAEIAVSCALRITVSADEAGEFAPGQSWAYIRGDDPHEETHPCRVSRVLENREDASVEVELIPEDGTLLPIGMNVRVVDAQE